MNRYQLLKIIYEKAREAGTINYRHPVPADMNIFDVDYLIEMGHLNYDANSHTIGITIKGIMLVESTQVNAFGRVALANILGYFEALDGSYTVSNSIGKLH